MTIRALLYLYRIFCSKDEYLRGKSCGRRSVSTLKFLQSYPEGGPSPLKGVQEKAFLHSRCCYFKDLGGRSSLLQNRLPVRGFEQGNSIFSPLTFATPSMAPLTADFGPSSILIQGQNTPLREHPVPLPLGAKSVLDKGEVAGSRLWVGSFGGRGCFRFNMEKEIR